MIEQEVVVENPLQALLSELTEYGYTDLRVLPSGEIAGCLEYLFTSGLVVGMTGAGYRTRYCFEHTEDAKAALEGWDGSGDPSGPWIKRKGDKEYLNPKLQAF